MKQDYKIEVRDFDCKEEIEEYKNLLKEKWYNNVYYSVEHLQYFAKEQDILKYFLLKKSSEAIIMMPFIYRRIVLNGVEEPYFDVISPYGYNGPIFNEDISDEELNIFWSLVDQWYKENNVISEFIRFSLNQNHVGYSGNLIHTLSNVKGLLKDNFQDQWTAFLPKVRNNYRKALSYNLKFKIYHQDTITKEVIEIFNKIYTETMKRNNASSLYFFSDEYFQNLILSNSGNFSIAFAYYEDIPISAELIINYRKKIFAFLGGTNAEYFSHRPNDFLRVKIIDWSINNGFNFYILGGGMKDGDGLYKSKKALFPKDDDYMFYTGRKIIDQDIYTMLSIKKDKMYAELSEKDLKDCFFPYYRKPDVN